MPSRSTVPTITAARVDNVEFHGDRLVAVVVENGELILPLLSVCQAMGLDERRQQRRLQDHDVLAPALRRVRIQVDGQLRSVVGLERSHIAFWLATIAPDQVAASVRPKLVQYQTELVALLDSIYGLRSMPQGVANSGGPALAPLVERITALALQLEAARQELRLELRRLGETAVAQDSRLAALEDVVTQQLTVVQGQLDATQSQLQETQERLMDTVRVTAAQAAVIQAGVQRIGKRVEQQTGKRIYDRLWSEFHFELGTHKYDELPAAKYEAALAFLKKKANEWLPNEPDILPGLQERLW